MDVLRVAPLVPDNIGWVRRSERTRFGVWDATSVHLDGNGAGYPYIDR